MKYVLFVCTHNEVGIDLSGQKPKRLTVEMQLHADWAVTMGCGDICPGGFVGRLGVHFAA